jgi:hypothetical protein
MSPAAGFVSDVNRSASAGLHEASKAQSTSITSTAPVHIEPEQSGSGVGIVANDSCRRRVNSIAVACDKSRLTPFVKLAFTCGWLEPGRCIGITEVTCPKYAPTTTSPLMWM